MHQLAVVGNPIEHSRSPRIWQQFADECNIELSYSKIFSPLDDFEHIVSDFFKKDGLALNITAPFKARAYTLANTHHHDSMIAKSANLLWMKDDLITAYNTDGVGLVNDILRRGFSLADKKILILGSGSVIHSVIPALELKKPSRIDLLMRNWDKLDDFMNVSRFIDEYDSQITYDIIINTTPNMPENKLFQEVVKISDGALIYDMIYIAEETLFMQAMKKVNPQLNAVNGLGMLIEQAAAGFEIVFGIKPPTTKIYQLLQG